MMSSWDLFFFLKFIFVFPKLIVSIHKQSIFKVYFCSSYHHQNVTQFLKT